MPVRSLFPIAERESTEVPIRKVSQRRGSSKTLCLPVHSTTDPVELLSPRSGRQVKPVVLELLNATIAEGRKKWLLSQKCEAGRRALNGSACESLKAGQHPGWAILRCVNHGNNEGGSKRGAVIHNFHQNNMAPA